MQEKPFPAEKIGLLKNIIVTREQLRTELGNPHVTRENEKYWFYGKTYVSSHILFVPFPIFDEVVDYNWLVVVFDENEHVSGLEVVEFLFGCTSSGICLMNSYTASYEETAQHEYQLTPRAIFSAPGQDDRLAKELIPTQTGCSIYIYSKARESVSFIIDGEENPPLNDKTFARMTIPEGPHEVSLSADCIREKTCKAEQLSVHCSHGSLHFIEIDTRWQWKRLFSINPGPADFVLRVVATEQGKENIITRRLRLSD